MSERAIGRSVFNAVGGIPLFLTAPLYRRWHLRWGATDEEVHAHMPGDEIVADASFTATRAITINAAPEQVWPWIVQIGYRRAGFYTYDLLDNAGYPSATTILPQYQHVQIGNWMPMAKTVTETTAFKVTSFDPGRWLLWEKPDSTWAWKLIPRDGGRTRLISRLRQRYRWQTPGSALLTVILLEFGDYPMMRRLLKGIKDRSEHKKNGRSPDTPTNPPPGHEHDVADS
jgi:hypothetical protein